MEVIKRILSDLEFIPEANENEYVGKTDIYQFVLEHSGYKGIGDSLNFFYIKLAANAISAELYRQDNHGIPSFDEDYIIEQLNDREEHEYHSLFEYYLGKQKYLEYHTINQKTYFFGEGLKLEYDLLIKTFAIFITADLNLALEKVKRNLLKNVKLENWCDLILGGHDNEYLTMEKERIESIVIGILE